MKVSRTIYLVDNDASERHTLSVFLESCGYSVRLFLSADAFLDETEDLAEGVMLLDQQLPGMSGLELQAELSKRGIVLPIIFITARGDVQMSVKAIKAGAINFLEKPLNNKELLNSIREAFSLADGYKAHRHTATELRRRHANLKDREREVMQYVVAGMANKDIAKLLGLSVRTIEGHRRSVMKKMGAESLPDLVRIYVMCLDAALIPNATLTKQRYGS